MQRLFIAFKALCIALLALTTLPAHCMKRNFELSTQNASKPAALTLTNLSAENLLGIFSFCHPENSHSRLSLLETAIRDFINLRLVCTTIDKALSFENIGKLCENYTELEKSNLLQKTLFANIDTYKLMRLPAAITLVTYKNASKGNTLQACLLTKAINCNDLQVAEVASRNQTNPNVQHRLKYDACHLAQTKEMLALLFEKGADIHLTYPNRSNKPNLLWHYIEPHYKSDMLHYCLVLKVNPTALSKTTCLLHRFALAPSSKDIPDLADYLLKGKYLLNAEPALINHQDSSESTPLDYAYYALESAHKQGNTDGKGAAAAIITFLRLNGALTGIEVSQLKLEGHQYKKRFKKTLADDFSCMRI